MGGASPERADRISPKCGIGRYDGHLMLDGLAGENPVERIFVQIGESRQSQNGGLGNVEGFDTTKFSLGRNQEIRMLRQQQFSELVLHCYFPSRDGAEIETVVGIFQS